MIISSIGGSVWLHSNGQLLCQDFPYWDLPRANFLVGPLTWRDSPLKNKTLTRGWGKQLDLSRETGRRAEWSNRWNGNESVDPCKGATYHAWPEGEARFTDEIGDNSDNYPACLVWTNTGLVQFVVVNRSDDVSLPVIRKSPHRSLSRKENTHTHTQHKVNYSWANPCKHKVYNITCDNIYIYT